MGPPYYPSTCRNVGATKRAQREEERKKERRKVPPEARRPIATRFPPGRSGNPRWRTRLALPTPEPTKNPPPPGTTAVSRWCGGVGDAEGRRYLGLARDSAYRRIGKWGPLSQGKRRRDKSGECKHTSYVPYSRHYRRTSSRLCILIPACRRRAIAPRAPA